MISLIDRHSAAGRVIDMLAEIRGHGRISGAEEQVVLDLIYHPSFPAELKEDPDNLRSYIQRKQAQEASQ